MTGSRFILKSRKCIICPYKLGQVKSIVSPCTKCNKSRNKNHPFPEPELKEAVRSAIQINEKNKTL